jgi:alpha-amylase/alpha-mannosidase (GH57 family)
MEKYVCIHGHFYQPPRENPWLETVELQDSSAPYHDWNERITAECYGRNTAARILDGEGRIESIVNNYSKISFNFGPTVLTWMKDKMPWVHDAIVEADKQSQKNYSGHGNAVAQVYNHMILPLGNERDKRTQVLWGIRDFESRFGRKPEGMWLAETAADSETLEALAEQGIKFTIFSPYQAKAARKIGDEQWDDVNGARIDPTRAYRINLPSGRNIVGFFYDSPVSQAVAFEKLLDSGEKLANRLMSAFSDQREWDQLVHIGTDGESYGHHHRYGEMALAYALRFIETNKLAKLTNYGEFLEKHPPTHEAQIHEKSAWSCSHGVGRWMEDCGCNSGGHGGWNQGWRAPLRHALDWLRDEIAPVFEREAGKYLKDPWAARNDYIAVILDRTDESIDAFLKQHAIRELNGEERVSVLELMELQRHAMLMYTSCGWFFDELSGLETVQVIQYAARVIQLAEDVIGAGLEGGFLERLEKARSNIPENSDGRNIYNKFVKPAIITWNSVVAHYGISSMFENYGESTKIFLYSFEEKNRQFYTAGKAKLGMGTVKVTFDTTRESRTRSYAVLYLGEHNLTAGVKQFGNEEEFNKMAEDLRASFDRADFAETIRLIDRHFGKSSYSLRSLFKDEQRRILNEILSTTREDLENRYRLIAERYTPLMKFLSSISAPYPPALKTATDFMLHVDICRQIEAEETDFGLVQSYIQDAQQRGVPIFDADLSYALKRKLERLMEVIWNDATNIRAAEQAAKMAELARVLPIDPNLWNVRTTYWRMLQETLPARRDKAWKGDEEAQGWVKHFLALGDQLGFAKKHLQGKEE